jgi:DNA polymerase-3 subunit beta
LTVDKTVLRRVIRQALRVVPFFSESTLLMQVVWLSASNGACTATAGNGIETVAQQVVLDSPAEGDGEVAVPVRLLARILRTLPDGPVTLAAGGGFVTVAAGSFETRFRELGPDEAERSLAAAEHRFEASLPASVLSEGFNHLALALGHSRAWGAGLVGVELTAASELLRFAATDRQQLALVELPVPDQSTPVTGQDGSLLLSNSALDLIAVLLPGDGQVQLRIGDDQVDFLIDGLAVRCRLQDDLYPDYAPIVNVETTRRVELSRRKLAAAVERVAIMAKRVGAATVWMQLGTDEVRVRATDLEIGEAIETRPASISGDACELGLYLWGFLAIVRRLRGNNLIIEFGHPDKPITLHTAEHPMFRYHLMPLTTSPPPSRITNQ